MLLLLATLPFLQGAGPAPSRPERTLIAVTRSGVQVEAARRPEAGALEIETPFGLFRTPTDPVAVVMSLAGAPAGPGQPARVAARTLAEEGRLTELGRLAETARQGGDSGLMLAAVEALEAWGARLDPVPARVPRKARLEWLWREIGRADPPRAAALTGRFVKELPAAGRGSDNRDFSLTDLRRGLESPRPWVRRAAALAIGRKMPADLSLAPRLLALSLHDPDPRVRDGAARGAAGAWSDLADNYWYQAVTRAPEAERIAAAYHLAHFGGPRAADYLAFSLSVFDKKLGRRFSLDGKEVQVVDRTREPVLPLLGGRAGGDCGQVHPIAITPDPDAFEHRSRIAITKASPAVTEALARALTELTGETRPRTPEEWIAWYRARHLKVAITPGN